MSKVKTTLKEPDIDNRLLDDRGPTVELLAKVAIIQGDTGTISLRAQQSPIERAVARGTISEQHGRAADRYSHYWWGARFPTIPTNWKSELSPGGVFDNIPLAKTELAQFNRDRFYQARAAIHKQMDRCGMSLDALSLLDYVVLGETPFEDAGKRVWPRMGFNAAGARAITYIRGALRVLSIEWNIS